jgi:hypothetical protein
MQYISEYSVLELEHSFISKEFISIYLHVLQGNGPVCHVETSPEILLIYRAHLVMIVHKILAANMQGCEKIAQSWIQQFKFAPLRTCATAARLVVALYSPVHSNRLHRPNADKAVKMTHGRFNHWAN